MAGYQPELYAGKNCAVAYRRRGCYPETGVRWSCSGGFSGTEFVCDISPAGIFQRGPARFSDAVCVSTERPYAGKRRYKGLFGKKRKARAVFRLQKKGSICVWNNLNISLQRRKAAP